MKYLKSFDSINSILAHKYKERTESLDEHIDSTYQVFLKLDNNYNILDKFNKSFSKMTFKSKGREFKLSYNALLILTEMFINSILLHDIGKINPKFQIDHMGNSLDKFMSIKTYEELEEKLPGMNNQHSLLSGIIYMDIFFKKIMKVKSLNERNILTYLLIVFTNSIICHHSKLDNLKDNITEEKLEEMISELEVSDFKYLLFYKDEFELRPEMGRALIGIKNIEFDTMTVYVWNKILYSTLTACDFIATHCFYKNIPIEEFELNNIQNISELQDVFKKSTIFQGILSYQKDKDFFKKSKLPLINELRSDILLECRYNIRKYINEMIFNIESPTGSGKTFNSISCALELLKTNSKLFYVFPTNTLSTQTKEVLDKLFKDKLDVREINSIAPLPLIPSSDGTIDYNRILLDRQLLNYESVVTSNVAFFNLLFGCNRSSSMGLLSLFNSTIILDEIQNYKNSIWRETIEFLYKFSEIMNFKLIIMSATLPNLEELIGFDNRRFVNLIDNPKKYYSNPLFKDRVKISKELLHKKVTFNDLLELILKEVSNRNKLENCYSKFLIEFITKNTAVDFYNYIKNKVPSDYKVYQLDGDDNNFKKSEIIQMSKETPKNNVILVTTQVIEAGVDIDFDLGAKDSVFPDVDEQFLGRINRSASKKNCKAFFFNYDKEQFIYKNDLRIGTNIANTKYFKCLLNKQFDFMYSKVFNEIAITKDTLTASFMHNFYKDTLKLVKNEDIYKNMKLIDTETFEVFIPYTVNGINGKKVWQQYNDIINDYTLPYAKKRVLLMNMRQYISYFTFSLYGKGLYNEEPIYGMYYIEDGIKFINNDKFNSDYFKMNYIIEK